MYKVHMDAKKLTVNFKSPDYIMDDKMIPALNVSASLDSTGTTHITLVNLDPNKKINLQTTLVGINWKTVTGQILTSAKLTDINTFENPNVIKNVTFNGAKKSGEQLQVELPAKSIVMLELK
jgi:alpha-N-arabinofuranosidase